MSILIIFLYKIISKFKFNFLNILKNLLKDSQKQIIYEKNIKNVIIKIHSNDNIHSY